MNVLYMVSWYFSCIEKEPVGVFHTEAVVNLQKHCNVAIYYPYEKNIEEFYRKKEELGILTYRSKYKLEKKVRNRVYMIKTFKIINEEFKPDIIHAHVGTEAGRFAVMLGKIFHIPVIITEHSSADLSGVRTFPHHFYAYWSYRGSKYNACVSDALTSDLTDIFPQYKFYTIYNGIAMNEPKEAGKNHRINGKVNMVMVAGMYDKYIKGIPNLLEAFKLVEKSRTDFVMHFVGDGEYRNEFEHIADQLGVKDVCIFHGKLQREEVWELVKQMDFLISASKYESFGCSIAEAAMIGTPILVTDSGGSKSILTPENGMLIKGYEKEDIAEGIIEMMSCFNKFRNEKNVQEAREKFSIESITQKYLDIYADVLK